MRAVAKWLVARPLNGVLVLAATSSPYLGFLSAALVVLLVLHDGVRVATFKAAGAAVLLGLIGVLGAFTTFSTFSIETLNLLEQAVRAPQSAELVLHADPNREAVQITVTSRSVIGREIRQLRLPQDVLDALPNLKVVSSYGVGYDAIDAVGAAARKVLLAAGRDAAVAALARLEGEGRQIQEHVVVLS